MIQLVINNKSLSIAEGTTVAAAIFASEAINFRRSVSGEPRFPLCGMGICFECRVTINGIKHQRSCQVLAEEGMIVNCEL
jgi:D-hydroxyproline dehydrogenase subunit gamma